MKLNIEAAKICQVINFLEDDALFDCREPVKYKIIYKGMGIEGASCQRHYELVREEVEKNGMSEMIKFVKMNNDNPKSVGPIE